MEPSLGVRTIRRVRVSKNSTHRLAANKVKEGEIAVCNGDVRQSAPLSFKSQTFNL